MPRVGLPEAISAALSPPVTGALAAAALTSGDWTELAVAPLFGFFMGIAFISVLPLAPVAVSAGGLGGVIGRGEVGERGRVALLAWSSPAYAAGAGAFSALGWGSMTFLAASYAVASAVLALATLRVRVSLHSAGVALPTAVLALVGGPRWFALLPLLPVVGWARVRVGVHTPAQVALGAAVGLLVPLTLWFL